MLRGARPTTRLVAAAAIVVAGTALVQGTGRADTIGLLAAAGALAGEIAFTMFAAAVLPSLGAVRVAAWSSALAVPLLLGGGLVLGEAAALRMPTATEALALTYLAVLMTVVAFIVWFVGLQRLGVERAGMIVGVMPIATLTTAAIMAGALPGIGQTLGVLTVAAGLALGLTTSGTGAPLGGAHGVGVGEGGPAQRGLGVLAGRVGRRPAQQPGAEVVAVGQRHVDAGPPGLAQDLRRPGPAPAATARSRPAPSRGPSRPA